MMILQLALAVALISGGSICHAILAGAGNSSSISQPSDVQQDTSSEKESKELLKINSNQNLTTTDSTADNSSHLSGELDANSTFYYEADAFLLNKSNKDNASKQQPPAADHRAVSGRNGRMLDLDALVGDLAASKANREARMQLTSRQSRNLMGNGGGPHKLDIGGGKRLHIQGFIPIVGVKDDDDDTTSDGTDDEQQARPHVTQQMSSTSQKQRPKMMTMMSSQMQPTFLSQQQNDLPYGQSSLGHATFNVQRYLNTDQTTGESNNHQFVPLPQMHSPQQQQQVVEAKFSNSNSPQASSGLVNTLKKPIKKLTNTFGGGANSDTGHARQLAQNCLCVPFYMCKGGQLSESSVGRAQLQQMINQQQQQVASQQPRQLMMGSGSEQVAPSGLVEPTRPGTVESLDGASYANSMVPVDERSLERDVITAAPVSLESGVADGGQNETSVSEMTQQQLTTTTSAKTEAVQQADASSPVAGLSTNITMTSSLVNPDEMTTLNQANDYTQDILGRMLGLKSAANQQQASERQQPGSGVCGLLRTCCAIPSHLLFSYGQQQQQQQQLIQQHDQLIQQQQQQQVALQRYQQPQSLMAVAPVQQVARMQTAATPGVSALQQLAALPSSLIHRTSSMALAPRPSNSAQQVQQYSRASYPQQPLHNFQQQQQVRQQPPVSAGPTPHVVRPVSVVGQQQQQLGTRKLLEGRCGLRQSTGINGRVQNLAYQENAAEFGEYPAQAAILKRLNGSESLFVCGGTLISQSWVATAAHCIRKHMQAGEQLKVRLGEWDVHRDDEFYPFVEKEVRDLVVHPEFVPGNLINDLALLRLDSPVDPTLPHVNPACLPTLDESFARQRCWVTGWGKDSFGTKGSFQAVLQEVELPVQGRAECELQLRQTRLGPHYRLHPGFICAGGETGKDACEGDGGSGLYCAQEGGVLKVAGLVSWGIGCGQAGVPGVYVNVAHYRPWIENIIAIDEDIYSSYNQLPNTLISERSPDGGGVVNSTTAPDHEEARHASANSTTTK